MKKRILWVLLTVVLCIGALALTVSAEETPEAKWGASKEALQGNYAVTLCDQSGKELGEPTQVMTDIDVDKQNIVYLYNPTTGDEGVYTLDESERIFMGFLWLLDGEYLASSGDVSKTKPATGGYAYFNDGVLLLHDFTLTGDTGIGSNAPLTVVLEGNNLINVTVDEGLENDYGLTIKGDGSLSITTMEYDGIEVDDGDLTIESGTLNITVLQSEPDYAADGIDMTDGDIIINGGKITIVATDHGIEVDNSIEDGEHAFGVIINGGILNITAGNEGIDAEDYLEINGGTITIHDADIGLDVGGDVEINDGTLNITCEDDGIEASATLTINGGDITIDSGNIGLYGREGITVRGGSFSIIAAETAIATYGELDIPASWGKIATFEEDLGVVRSYLVGADGNELTELNASGEQPVAQPTTTLWLPVLARLYSTELPVTVIAGEGGSIDAPNTIKYGRNAVCTITPDEGFIIADVLVNGKSVGAVREYTFKKVRRAQTIEVIFAPDPDAAVEEPADDIADPMYSFDIAA